MMKKYDVFYLALFECLCIYLCRFMRQMSMHALDIRYDAPEMIYIILFGIFGLSVLFHYGYFNRIFSSFVAFEIIRHQDHKRIMKRYCLHCFMYAFLSALLMIVTALCFSLHVSFLMGILLFLSFYTMLMIQMFFELLINEKISLFLCVSYSALIFTLSDLAHEAGISSLRPFFLSCVPFPARMGSLSMTLCVFVFINILLYVGNIVCMKKKDII